jgi:hypothetical protein
MLVPENKKFSLTTHLPGNHVGTIIALFYQRSLQLDSLSLVKIAFKKPDWADFHYKLSSGLLFLNIKDKKFSLTGITGLHLYIDNFAFKGDLFIHIVKIFSLSHLRGRKNIGGQKEKPTDD